MLFFKKKSKPSEEKKKQVEEKKPEKEAVKQVKEKAGKKPEIKKEQKLEEKPQKISAEKEDKQKPLAVQEKKPTQALSKKATRIAPHVLVRPVITEKATYAEARGIYTFEVVLRANKISVKKAIKELYNVEPVKVRIIRTTGKQVRYGRSVGRTKNRKKAMVYLKSDDKIEFVRKQ
ncbi:50S ribosomal protein L23 [Patescibacteria group bacterium AH-259-L05]|nr:50S ribosomal protein L23 [Patescibacteria group bacterium AH-259-L05]